jgi:release factor glutamine methyltransferase
MTLVTRNEAVTALRAAGCVFAEDEAAVLAEATAGDAGALARLVARRAGGEPLEQVVGYADFAGVRIRLRPGVFVPRVRSALLVRVAVAHTAADAVVLDLCCGSGALGLAVRAHRPGIRLYAADADPLAVACARDNLGGAHVYQGDLYDPLPPLPVDVLIANVPYVATGHLPLLPAEARDHEPRIALDGGADGLDVFRRVVAAAPAWLTPGGLLLSEITEAQIYPATAAVRAAGLRPGVEHDDELEATVITAVR